MIWYRGMAGYNAIARGGAGNQRSKRRSPACYRCTAAFPVPVTFGCGVHHVALGFGPAAIVSIMDSII